MTLAQLCTCCSCRLRQAWLHTSCRHAGCAQLHLPCCRSRFAADGGGPAAAAREFKQLVKQLHEAGIEVILDVVYNHTVEGASLVSTESTRDISRCVHRLLECICEWSTLTCS